MLLALLVFLVMRIAFCAGSPMLGLLILVFPASAALIVFLLILHLVRALLLLLMLVLSLLFCGLGIVRKAAARPLRILVQHAPHKALVGRHKLKHRPRRCLA